LLAWKGKGNRKKKVSGVPMERGKLRQKVLATRSSLLRSGDQVGTGDIVGGDHWDYTCKESGNYLVLERGGRKKIDPS